MEKARCVYGCDNESTSKEKQGTERNILELSSSIFDIDSLSSEGLNIKIVNILVATASELSHRKWNSCVSFCQQQPCITYILGDHAGETGQLEVITNLLLLQNFVGFFADIYNAIV